MPYDYVASIDFEFGGVKVRRGEPVPVHRKPWSALLAYGGMYVAPVDPGTRTLHDDSATIDIRSMWTDICPHCGYDRHRCSCR